MKYPCGRCGATIKAGELQRRDPNSGTVRLNSYTGPGMVAMCPECAERHDKDGLEFLAKTGSVMERFAYWAIGALGVGFALFVVAAACLWFFYVKPH